MFAAAPQWVEVARGVGGIVQVVAIVVGGSWAYYKFAKGRTFKPRAEVGLDACIIEADGVAALSVSAKFRNTGLAYVDLPPLKGRDDDGLRVLRIWGTDAATPGTNPYWGDTGDELIVADVFEGHDGCEAGETLVDHLLLPVPSGPEGPWLAYRVELLVVSPTRIGPTGRPRPWITTTVVADALTERPKPTSEGIAHAAS
ncbi:MAG TPA: hypothetical protein VF526_16520 [Solirubrobacteraceae bacterium]|jgi:hypothetical protein